jgi:hypothetical protein
MCGSPYQLDTLSGATFRHISLKKVQNFIYVFDDESGFRIALNAIAVRATLLTPSILRVLHLTPIGLDVTLLHALGETIPGTECPEKLQFPLSE